MEAYDKGKQGEDFVNSIAFNSFLKYWCYPNPLDVVGDNKEICDLLIVFDSICIIVSVKNYNFKGDYTSYFKKTTSKAIRQISGAERKLFGDNPLLMKHPDRNAEEFPKHLITQTYRVVVNLNPTTKFYQTSFYQDDKHYIVVDAGAWRDALIELNTIPDFLKYLESRCKLFNKYPGYILPREEYDFGPNDGHYLWKEMETLSKETKGTFILGSELDLIALYIKYGFEFPKNLNHDKADMLNIKIDGEWKKYAESKVIAAKENLEKESYFIDRLVRELLINQNEGHRLAMMFFRLNRFERSAFAKKYLDYHKKLAESSEPIQFNRTHSIFPSMNMVFFYFVDDYPEEQLKNFMHLSITHHYYLFDFKVKEVGLLGVSKSFQKFAFGHSSEMEPLDFAQREEYEEVFKELGWKLK